MRDQELFNKIETLKLKVKQDKEDLRKNLEELDDMKLVKKEMYDLEQKMLALKVKKKNIEEDYKSKNFNKYETINDEKLEIELRKEELVDVILDKNRKGEEIKIFKEKENGKKERIIVEFKPVFKKVKENKKNK